MFKRDVKGIRDLIMQNLRNNGLETPLLQKRLVDAWPVVAGEVIQRYTQHAYIYNQVLYVHLSSPALRAELGMRRQYYIQQLNNYVGANVIVDIKFN